MAKQTIPVQAGGPKNGPKHERRVWVRFASDREACCQPLIAETTDDLETNWPGKIRDASAGGLGLIVKRRFEPGTVLNVELAVKPEGRRSFLGRVIHATPDRKGRWVIGCVFAKPSQQKLKILLPEQQSSSA